MTRPNRNRAAPKASPSNLAEGSRKVLPPATREALSVAPGPVPPEAPLTVAEATAAHSEALKALQEATSLKGDLEARLASGDFTITPEMLEDTDRTIRFLSLATKGHLRRLQDAEDADSIARSIDFRKEVERTLPPLAQALANARENATKAIGVEVRAAAAYKTAHAELTRHSQNLPGHDAAADPERRQLPPHLADLFYLSKFAPKIDGTIYQANWSIAPALVTEAIRTIIESIPEGHLEPKYRNFLRDQIGKGIDPATGRPTSQLFVEMSNEAANFSRLFSTLPARSTPIKEPPAPDLPLPPAPTISEPAASEPVREVPELRGDGPRLEPWWETRGETIPPGTPIQNDPGEYDGREPYEYGKGATTSIRDESHEASNGDQQDRPREG